MLNTTLLGKGLTQGIPDGNSAGPNYGLLALVVSLGYTVHSAKNTFLTPCLVYFAEKTFKSHHSQMILQSQRFSPSYSKTLWIGPTEAFT